MSLYDIAVARKLSGGGGGGGSSIVHPVQVTITNNVSYGVNFLAMAGTDDPMSGQNTGFYIDPSSGLTRIDNNSNWLPTLESGTTTVLPVAYVLEGGVIYLFDFMGEHYTYTLSENATQTQVDIYDAIAITGDCTITIA